MNIKLINATVFYGDTIQESATICIEDEKFTHDDTIKFSKIIDCENDWIVPGFIDLQVYGGDGKLFSNDPTVDTLKTIYAYCLAGGATTILPTIATNSFEIISRSIDAVKKYQQQNLPGILGLHVEGPFINPLKKGAHLQKYITRPTMDIAKKIVDEAKGVIKIITLAPECCDNQVMDFFMENGIHISAGHSDTTYEQSIQYFNKIKLVTHLFNAMSPLHHRDPGLPGATLVSNDVYASIVADGYHVHFEMISLAKRLMGERLFLITDAVTDCDGVYPHQLKGDRYLLPDGTLSGSALTMIKAVKNCVEKARISIDEVFRMATLYPAKAIGLNDLGNLRPGSKADCLRISKQLEIKIVLKNGISVTQKR